MHEVMIALLVAAIAAGATGLGYRIGFRHGLVCLVPWVLLEELVWHKLLCRGESPARVRIELAAHLRLGDEEVERLIKRTSGDQERAA